MPGGERGLTTPQQKASGEMMLAEGRGGAVCALGSGAAAEGVLC